MEIQSVFTNSVVCMCKQQTHEQEIGKSPNLMLRIDAKLLTTLGKQEKKTIAQIDLTRKNRLLNHYTRSWKITLKHFPGKCIFGAVLEGNSRLSIPLKWPVKAWLPVQYNKKKKKIQLIGSQEK